MSVAPRSATPGPRSTSAIRGPPFSSAAGRTSSRPPPTSSSHSISILGPCGTTKTTNKVPTIVKQEEPEVPNKDPKGFQTLKLSAQSSSSVAPEAQKPAIVTGPLTPKAKQMPVRRGDVNSGTSIPTQPAYTTGRPVVRPPEPGTSTGPRQPPTPPPSGVVEPPEPTSDQAKVKFWRDRALQAEARLQERDQRIRQHLHSPNALKRRLRTLERSSCPIIAFVSSRECYRGQRPLRAAAINECWVWHASVT